MRVKVTFVVVTELTVTVGVLFAVSSAVVIPVEAVLPGNVVGEDAVYLKDTVYGVSGTNAAPPSVRVVRVTVSVNGT